ncbi:hypothetical protein D3C80_2099890 [compost metagenome]
MAETEQITATIRQIAVLAERNADVSEYIKDSALEQRSSAGKIVDSAESLNEISGKLEHMVEELKI